MSLMQPYPLHNNNYGTWNPLKIVKLRISDVFSATLKARLNAHIYVVVLCRSHVVILLSIGCRDGSPVQIVLLLVNKYLFSLKGGQGLFLRSIYHFGRSSEAKDHKTPRKVKCDGRTDGRTDGPTDRPTKRGVESRSTRLRRKNPSALISITEPFLLN